MDGCDARSVSALKAQKRSFSFPSRVTWQPTVHTNIPLMDKILTTWETSRQTEMRPYILCQGAARDVFGGLDVATDEAASVVLKIQNGSLNEEAVVPKDDEKDDDDNEEEYNGTVHPAFEPKQSAATRARHRTDMTVALSLGVDLNSMDAQHMNCTPASLLLPDEEIHDEEDNATPKAPPMSFAGLAHCQIVDMKIVQNMERSKHRH